MSFSIEDLRKIAKLARLSMSDQELEQLALSRIVDFVTKLNEINVDTVLPMSHAGNRSLPLRADEASVPLGRACISSSAGYDDGLIKVAKIIE